MMRHLLIGPALALLTGPALAQTECGDVSITEMDWASSTVVTAVAEFLMSQGYGCDVTKVPSSTNPALTSVAETGEPDILTELWTGAAPVYDRLKAEGKVEPLARVLSDGGVDGWYVPDYMVEETPELATVEGVLANVDKLGDQFHQCPDGWACKTITANALRVTGLDQMEIEIFQHGSGETLATSIAAAYEDRAPWIGYYWGPTAILGEYPMTRVEFGEHKPEVFECWSTDDCTTDEMTDYRNSPVFTVVTDAFAAREPQVVEMLARMQFTNDQMSEVLAWQIANNASPGEAAVHFLTTYTDVWSTWLNDSARERLSAVLQ